MVLLVEWGFSLENEEFDDGYVDEGFDPLNEIIDWLGFDNDNDYFAALVAEKSDIFKRAIY